MGEITSENLKEVKSCEEIKANLLANYDLACEDLSDLIHNSRTFVHQLAHKLGVEENYKKIVKHHGYLAALNRSLVAYGSAHSIFEADASIFLSIKDKTFLEDLLPFDYRIATWEYQLGGMVPFGESMRHK